MFRVAVRARGRSLCVSDRDHREKRDYARHGEKKNTKNPELPSISRDGFGWENSNEHLPIWNGPCTCTERRSFDRPNPSLRPDRLVLHNLQIRYCYRDCENGGLNEIQEKDRN